MNSARRGRITSTLCKNYQLLTIKVLASTKLPTLISTKKRETVILKYTNVYKDFLTHVLMDQDARNTTQLKV